MSRIKVRDIKKQALVLLKEHKPDYRKIVFQSVGITAVYSLAVSVVSMILNSSIDGGEGLSGLGTAAFLMTAQMFLVLVGSVLMPFWNIGLQYTSVRVARRQNTEFSMLTRGFQRYGPVLRYLLLYGLILVVLVILSINVVMLFAVCIPIPPALYEAVGALEETEMMEMMNDPNAMTDFMMQLPADQLMLYYTPIVILSFLVFTAFYLIVYYRFCVARYLIVDETKIGAFAAMHISSQMTKGNRWSLFKLDLSFWWYSLVLTLIMLIPYIPEVLTSIGVQLPISDALSALIFGGVSVLLELAWAVAAGAYAYVAWTCAYEALRVPPQQPEKMEEQTI